MYLNDRIELQTIATETLLKFCVDHHGVEARFVFKPIEHIQSCLEALKQGDIQQAMEHYLAVHLGKDGFNEWKPPCVYEHETRTYVAEVFGALLSKWSILMKLSIPNTCAACGKEIPILRVCPKCYLHQLS